jgi:hypothetical protein
VPTSDLKAVIVNVTKKKRKMTVKQRNIAVSKMSTEDFNAYLRSKLRSDVQVGHMEYDVMPTENLAVMAHFLLMKNKDITASDNEILKLKIQFGEWLCVAQRRFMAVKRREKLHDTWNSWILAQVKISFKYAQKLMQMSKMVKNYPKILNLSVTFSELFGMRKKIQMIFSKSTDIGNEWQ